MHNDVYEPVAYTTGMAGTAAVKLEAPGLLLLNNNPLTINNCVEVWYTVEPPLADISQLRCPLDMVPIEALLIQYLKNTPKCGHLTIP